MFHGPGPVCDSLGWIVQSQTKLSHDVPVKEEEKNHLSTRADTFGSAMFHRVDTPVCAIYSVLIIMMMMMTMKTITRTRTRTRTRRRRRRRRRRTTTVVVVVVVVAVAVAAAAAVVVVVVVVAVVLVVITLKGAIRELFTISSLSRELSPTHTHTLKWSGRNRVQITCNTSSACTCNLQCSTWYEGTDQLLSVTELKSH